MKYSVTLNIELISDNDADAIRDALAIAAKMDRKHDNRAMVMEIHRRGGAQSNIVYGGLNKEKK